MPVHTSPSNAQASCAVSLNAAGSIVHFWRASALAVRLRRTASAQPSSCQHVCLHVHVDAHQYHTIRRAGMLPALHSIWDSIAPYPPTPPMRVRGRGVGVFQETPAIWLKRIQALRALATWHASVLQLDSDAFPCHGWASLFDTRAALQVQVMSARPAAFFSGSGGDPELPAPLGLAASERARWAGFHERNLGFVMLHTASARARGLLSAFQREFIRQVNDSSLTKLVSDQAPWRSALYSALHSSARPALREHLLPSSTVCRPTVASLEEHYAAHGRGRCGPCLFMHHKHVEDTMVAGAWGGLENATWATASWPWRKQQLLASLPGDQLRSRSQLQCRLGSRAAPPAPHTTHEPWDLPG